MWDSKLRNKEKYKDNGNGYFTYIIKFQTDLQNPANKSKALVHHKNPIRGWDIEKMINR